MIDSRDIVEKRIQVTHNHAEKHCQAIDGELSIASLVPFNTATSDSRSSKLPANWCSLPNGYRLNEVMLWGPPPIVPLRPYKTESEFEERWGFTIPEVEELSNAGCLHLDIYSWKNTEGWSNAHPELDRLLTKATVIGSVFATYREAVGLTNSDDERTNYISKCLASASRETVLTISRDEHSAPKVENDADTKGYAQLLEHLSLAWGSRFPYLDALATSELVEYIEQLFDKGELQLAVDELRWHKHRLASPLSAAVGGECWWGQIECDRANRAATFRQGSSGVIIRPPWWGIDKTLLDISCTLLTDRWPLSKTARPDVRELITLLKDSQFQKTRSSLMADMREVSSRWCKNGIDDDELWDLVSSCKKHQESMLNWAPWCLNSSFGLYGSLIGTWMFGPLGSAIGLGTGFVAHKLKASEFITRQTMQVDPIHRLMFRIEDIRNRPG